MDFMLIYIKISTQKKICLEIPSSETFRDLKMLIQEKEKIPFRNQLLVYDNKELDDLEKISFSKVKYGDTINLVMKKIQFKIKYLGVEIEFFYESMDMTIKKIKEEIQKKHGLEITKQILIYKGITLEDNKTIQDYDIKEDSVITLKLDEKNIQIFIKNFSSKVIAIDAKLSDTIGQIKSKIKDKNGIPNYNQRLIISGKELQDNKTLYNYGIKNNSTIHLVLKENKNECTLFYKIKDEDKNFRIIGENFYQNNAINCKIEINGKESKLYEFYEIKGNEKDVVNIKLIKNEDITDMSYMFCGCSSLLTIENFSNWNTTKVTKMNNMFNGCQSLISLPDISNWNTSNVVSMNYMFSGCESLQKLPDISKWDIKNVTNLRGIFSKCKSLLEIPDISKWDTSNVNDISFMLSECSLLTSIPDLSKWKINKVVYMANMFSKCMSLKSLPDISKWDISNVKYMPYMFEDCSSLISFPDISNWDFTNVKDFRFMFKGCQKNYLEEIKQNFKLYSIRNDDLKYLPQIELKFNDANLISINLVDDLKHEIQNIINENNFSIIEIKKGSLTVLLSLQFLVMNEIEKLKNNNIKEFDIFEFSHKFSQKIKSDIQKIVKILLDTPFITFGIIKPNIVEGNILDIDGEKLLKKINKIGDNKTDVLEISINCKTESSCNTDNNESKSNIYETSKNISISDLKDFYNSLSVTADKQELNQKKLIDKLDEFNRIFDLEIEKALKESIFEYKIINIYIIDRKDIDKYIEEKNKCPNRTEKNLFHGSIIDCCKSILVSQFRDSKSHAFGKGVYFTDMLDYVWRYSKEKRENNIPKIDETFSFVSSDIYYDNTKKDVVYDTKKKNEEVPKYGIRCGFGNFTGHKLNKDEINKSNKLFGNEFLITEKNQILPLYCITMKRIENIIVWRDYNFIKNNPNKYSGKVFNKIQEFHKVLKKKIQNEFDSKIYYSSSTEEALKLINRKKYNKVIIITNGNNNAKDFIISAREIIGNNTIAAVSVYDIKKHYKWIKEIDNTILLNGIKYHEKFLESIMNQDIKYLVNLKEEIINDFRKTIKDFDMGKIEKNIYDYPLFKTEGKFSDIEISTEY